jgi:hypothetical protein
VPYFRRVKPTPVALRDPAEWPDHHPLQRVAPCAWLGKDKKCCKKYKKGKRCKKCPKA